jgi:surfeit locus 1 family protein
MPAASARFRFRPPWWGVLLAAAGCAAGIALGLWQSGRAAEKRAAAAQRPEQVTVIGTFAPKYTVLLDNKLRHGRPGYEVVTPLKLKGSDFHVLVNRGWVAGNARREILPEVRTPTAEVRIEGLALERFPRSLVLPERGSPVRQNLDIKAYAAETGLTLQPRVIEQHSALDDGLSRTWPAEDSGAEKNEAYALQWYSLAALSIALLLFLNLKVERTES